MFDNQATGMAPNQGSIDYSAIDNLLKNGAQSITVDTGDTKMTMKKVGVPTGQAQRDMSGNMQVRGVNDIIQQDGSPLGKALEGLASRLGLSGGPVNQGKGAAMLNELAGFIANNFGRNQMGTQHLGSGEPPMPLPDTLRMASAVNGGAPTVPEQLQAPAPVPAGSGMSTQSMGMLGPQMGPTSQPSGGMGGLSGLAGLLGPIMAAAGKGSAPSAMSPAIPIASRPMMPSGLSGLNPQIAQLLGIPGRADGGPVEAGRPYVVGEEGPEVMVPNASGAILPNDAIGADMATDGIDSQVSSLIDELIQEAQDRGIPLLGPDGNISPEAIALFIQLLQSKAPAQTSQLDPLASQIGGGQIPEPGSDPLMGTVGSGAGGSNDVPILDGLNSGSSISPDITGSTPSGPDDIEALLASLGG